MSDTPETDSATLRAHDIYCGGDFDAVDVEHSKKLERERDEALRKLESLERSIASLDHPNLKMLLKERDEALKKIRKLEVENDHNWQANELAEEAFMERDEAHRQLAAAKREAEYLAKIIHRSEYSDAAQNLALCDSVAGVISQIDNMYSGVRAQQDEAINETHQVREFMYYAFRKYEKELNAERALADRLAKDLDDLWHRHSLTGAAYEVIESALAAWKEARK